MLITCVILESSTTFVNRYLYIRSYKLILFSSRNTKNIITVFKVYNKYQQKRKSNLWKNFRTIFVKRHRNIEQTLMLQTFPRILVNIQRI